MNAAKKKKVTKKKCLKKILTKNKNKESPTHKILKGKFNGFDIEEEEKEYNCKKKHAWCKSVSRQLRLEHKEQLRKNGPPVPGEILTFPSARLTTKNCKHCFLINGTGQDKYHNKSFVGYLLTMVSWKFQQKKMSFNMNNFKPKKIHLFFILSH
jgi:hypothetical protein